MLLRVVCGNESAAHFLDLITNILHLWDDLQDKDKPITAEDINLAFWNALIELPRNAFYRQNFAELNPILAVAIQNWHAANEMEATESADDKQIAFIVRSSYVDLVIQSARICGGYEWARKVTTEIRRFWHGETFAGYLKNLAIEKAGGAK